MAKKRRKRLPQLCRHSSGQARVTLSGKVYYCGLYGTAEAHARYADLTTRWEANERRPLDPPATVVQARRVRDVLDDFARYLDASGRYRKNGSPTSARTRIQIALDEFATSCGTIRAADLTEVHVIRHRDTLEQRARLTRQGINVKIRLVRLALKWARERGIVSRAQWVGIAEIEPLSKAQCGGRDRKRQKRAVTCEDVERVATVAPTMVARMLRVQGAIGCRPGELCAMRWCDISPEIVDVDGVPCRIYVVAHAKNEHHGKDATTYCLTPSTMATMGTPTGPGDYVFPSPENRRGPYATHSYRSAVVRACARAQVPAFSPHEIRHGFLTRAANRYGVLAAAAAANHSTTATTQTYLHKDRLAGYRCAIGLAAEGGGS